MAQGATLTGGKSIKLNLGGNKSQVGKTININPSQNVSPKVGTVISLGNQASKQQVVHTPSQPKELGSCDAHDESVLAQHMGQESNERVFTVTLVALGASGRVYDVGFEGGFPEPVSIISLTASEQ